ncbi:MAG: hypothetical protein O7B35_01205 [Deltaproteobacteria bacterium]|nr:hypothetical protein [Deltaproteobacteria bacterium]
MGKLRNYIFAVAGFVILAGVFTVIGPYVDQGQADPPVKDVNVVNTPLPVEVQARTLDIVEIIEDNVPRETVVNVFTVPANRRLIISDLIISSAGSDARDIRILRDGLPAPSLITVSSTSAFTHTFATGIHFVAGEIVAVSHGSTGAAPVHFYLRGFLTNE